MSPTQALNAIPWAYGVAMVSCLAVLAYGLWTEFHGYQIWDDAHMFFRYAHHFHQTGVLAWNPGGEATYGLTSLLFLTVVYPLYLLMPGQPALVALLSSAIPGTAFVIALMALVRRSVDGPPWIRRAATVFVIYALAINAHSLVVVFTSGMETALVLLHLTLMLGGWSSLIENPSTPKRWFLGAMGGLAFLLRPDLAIFSLGVPGLLLFHQSGRREGLRVLWITTGFIAASLVGARLYFGVPLPHSFYVKNLTFYGQHVYDHYALKSFVEFGLFLISTRFLVVILAFDLCRVRRFFRESSIVEKVFLGASLVFAGYYLFFVLQIMGHNRRFYYPLLPIMAWVAAHSFSRVFRDYERVLAKLPRQGTWLLLAVMIASLYPATQDVRRRHQITREIAERVGRFDMATLYRHLPDPAWFALDAFSALPDDLVIATTEVGMPAILNLEKRVVDMAALNERSLILEGFDPERFLDRHRPDLIYMFHPHYVDMIEALENAPSFLSGYDYYPSDRGTGLMGVALRKSSRHYPAMKGIMRERLPSAE